MNNSRRIVVGVSFVSICVAVALSLLPNWDKKAGKAVSSMEKKVEKKHGIEIVDSKAMYDDKHQVYRGTFHTNDGITFEAERAKDGIKIIDFYQEAVWEKEAMEKWGNVSEYIPYVKDVSTYFDYGASSRIEDEGLSREDVSIVDVKNIVSLSVHINLDKPYLEDLEQNVKQGIFNYYHWLQENEGEKIQLFVGYLDSVSYHITWDEKIENIDDIKLWDFRTDNDI